MLLLSLVPSGIGFVLFVYGKNSNGGAHGRGAALSFTPISSNGAADCDRWCGSAPVWWAIQQAGELISVSSSICHSASVAARA